MAPVVTTGILIAENLLTRHPCARGHVNLSVSFHGRSTICACHPCARAMQFSPYRDQETSETRGAHRRIEKKKNMPDLDTNTYIHEFCVSSLHRCHAKILCAKKKKVQLNPYGRENRHSCEGSSILCGRLLRDIHTFGRAGEGSYVSPLRNTMGGLSGCGRGGDTSGVGSTPSFIISRLRARALALDLGCGTCCPPFVMRKTYTIEGSNTPRRKSPAMYRLCCSTLCARRSTSLASVLGASMFLAQGCLLGRSSPLSAAAMLLPALPREGELPGPGRTRYASSLPCPRFSCTCAASCTGALFTPLLSQYDFNTATCSGASPLVTARLRRNATHTCTNG